ncbi:MAG: pyruvate:ferredoxin (flavodoxin) oxidoreductase [Candidatus Cloacimonadota bacterium]|nr:MAG: pyruvate:ferredoxin (flavodoxin) oxidoreductase [Candidatus Cloacimonadota bacterium]PIE79189.1 MAG: pyruvate:ferredoxin (flavodoxin) oxidoreductase [Candidatus Delongbacteria bacterium]
MAKEKKFITCDGNYAAAHVAYMYSEVAAIYPITPSSDMGENADQMAAKGRINLFGQKLRVVEMQSEGGAAGAVHGSIQAGALTTTFTASQGLLLMIPNMYKIAGELTPTVFHVSARSLACSALSIFGDHSDVMSVRNTGYAMLAADSVQETMDMATIAHNATLEARVPFLHFFDGFRTSHEISKVELVTEEDMDALLDRDLVKAYKDSSMNPYNPTLRGTAQNPDIYFQGREGVNKYYDATPDIVENWMDKFAAQCGRQYKPFDYFGHPEAEKVIIAMGSGLQTIKEVISKKASEGEKVGVIAVRLYRPFSAKHFLKVLPKTTKVISALDRTKEPGSMGEPLLVDVRSLFSEVRAGYHGEEFKSLDPIIVGGRYGLSSKEFTPAMVVAILDNIEKELPKNSFTVGINDDVTNLSLEVGPRYNVLPNDVIQCKFYGVGSDGTVGANKNSIKIIGDNTSKYAQGYFVYDSKKSGGLTISHLRFGDSRIRAPYLIQDPDFVAVHNESYLGRYNVLDGIKEGATFLLNTELDRETLFANLPKKIQETIIEKRLNFYAINAFDVAKTVGLGNRINMVMQSCFFILSKVIEKEEAIRLSKEYIQKLYIKRGQKIVEMNWKAVDLAEENMFRVEVPSAVVENDIPPFALKGKNMPAFVKEVVEPVMRDEGNDIPVSKIPANGVFPSGLSKYEKRATATSFPVWNSETCIQCNQCSFACPHAVINPRYFSNKLAKDAPEVFKFAPAKSKNAKEQGLNYAIQCSPRDCTGCGVCVQVCPTKEKSIVMTSFIKQIETEDKKYEFFNSLPVGEMGGEKRETVKGSQFLPQLLEFHGACQGCGEVPYVKLMSQLFGERMYVANATGCSSIYGGTAPTSPYTTNNEGWGPAWSNSLFEDNAEYGLGMHVANKQMRGKLFDTLEELISEKVIDQKLIDAIEELKAVKDDFTLSKAPGLKVKQLFEECTVEDKRVQYVRDNSKFLMKLTQWIVGGDGWAYDIGYGGLDHVISTGENVNILVLDTEVYSNTGGQASKATPIGAVAKFAAAGMRRPKKDLGLIAMSYGDVYVASVSLGADKNQVLKAFLEAESYDGPSIIIAYSPCIAHGINLNKMMDRGKNAVDSNYWPIYTYDPRKADQGKNPLTLKNKDAKLSFEDFVGGEGRYKALNIVLKDEKRSKEVLEIAQKDSKKRLDHLRRLANLEY